MAFGTKIFGAAAAVALAASQASAVCPAGSTVVSPGFAGAINAAIAATGSGGTVCLEPGIYEEGATVTINKPLTLIGDGATSGETVIDAFGVGGPGIEVTGQNNVRLENLAVQQANGGDNILVTGNSFTAANIISRGGTSDCLQIDGNSPTVSGSSFIACFAGAGINVNSGNPGPILDDNTVRGNSSGIVAGSGINAQVTGNRVLNTNGTAIQGNGNNSQFTGNEITNASSGGLISSSDGSVFDGNSISGIPGSFAAIISGSNPRVSNNSVEDSLGGFLIGCTTVCDQGFVTGNTAFGTSGIQAFLITAGSNSYRIEDNQAVDSVSEGFNLNTPAGAISGNNTGRTLTGYVINGTGSALTDNIARTSVGSGLIINSSSNTITGTESRKNTRDGLTINGGTNTLVDTRSVRNKGEGVDVKGATTTVTNLTSRNNRIDCGIDGGSIAPGSSGVVCEDGSNFTVTSEIDDGI